MRGKGACNQAVCPDNGITPAYAGKRAPYTPTSSTPRDHPRVCGEKFGLPSHTFRWVGSPPHMRGKGRDGRLHPALLGITPAYAGKSPARPGPRPWRWDHPRICGEKFPNIHVPVCRSGSPPRMRGKAHAGIRGIHQRRITPAYAGKSSTRLSCRCRPWDHPRVCGEKSAQGSILQALPGSPPRMRGKVYLFRLMTCPVRITPAYAGKSYSIPGLIDHH